VEKKVSRTAAQELDARLRMLGSVRTARPSRRTTIPPISPSRECSSVRLGLDGCFESFRGARAADWTSPLGSPTPPHGKVRPACSVRNEPALVRGNGILLLRWYCNRILGGLIFKKPSEFLSLYIFASVY
jgi:hypothetical protein